MGARARSSVDSGTRRNHARETALGVDLRNARVPVFDAGRVYDYSPSFYTRSVKPLIDVFGALVLLVLLSPVLLACAIAIRSTMGGPVILRQPRVGRFGRVFTLYKFRSMEPDRREVDTRFDGPDRRVSHKSPADPRITEVGRFIRKWSLDELPQFVNVLLGQMSLVGPRPELVGIVAGYEPWQHRRHVVKPGITGLWQVSERSDRPLHECTHLDLEYVESVSVLLDIELLLRTPVSAFGSRKGH